MQVSVGVSRMGKTSVVFVEPGAKVNKVLLREGPWSRFASRHPYKMRPLQVDATTRRGAIAYC